MKYTHSIMERFGGSLFMLAGGILMVVLVVSFNKGVSEKERTAKNETRITAVKQSQKKVAPKPTPPKPANPKKSIARAAAPDLSSLIGDISMDIPELALNDVVGDSRELLDEVSADPVMNESTVDNKPSVLNRSPLQFPKKAAKQGLDGFVVVSLLIAENGQVEMAKILESQPEGVFDTSVLNGVRDWTFSPATYKGKPVKIWAKQKISFNS